MMCLSGAVMAQTAPSVTGYSDYTGDSFVANWSALSGATNYYLSVYSPGANNVDVSQDFSTINQTDGKINTDNPNYPAGWTVNVSSNGETDVVYYDSKNHVALDATGDYISNENIKGGNITSFVVNASLFNAENITQATSSVFKVEVYDKSGELSVTGQIESLYFASQTSLDLIEAFQSTPANVGYVKLMLIKDDGKIGDVAINSITYSYKAPEYVLTDYQTTDTSYKVTGLDPDKEYFYYVKADVDGAKTAESYIIRVNEFLTPTALSASEITNNSFTANWERLPKAKAYTLQAYKYNKSASSSETTILKDTFSKATEGTIDSPVSVTSADDVTDVAGWTGRNIIMANGMLGASAGRFPRNLSYLQTPTLNLSGNGGKYKIQIKAYGTAGDYLSLYIVGSMIDTDGDGTAETLNTHKATFDENGYVEETWEMTDGTETAVISIEESTLKQFLVDEITITSEGAADREVLTPVAIADGNQTSYTFTDLEEGGSYGYEVTGVRSDDYGYDENSETSNLVMVELTTSGINGVEADVDGKPVVAVDGKTIIVTLPEAMPINLVNLNGFVQTIQGKAGVNTIKVDNPKFLILNVGGESYKVVVK